MNLYRVKSSRGTEYVQAATAKDAAASLGLEAGRNCSVGRVILPPGETAASYIAKQTATEPSPTTTPTVAQSPEGYTGYKGLGEAETGTTPITTTRTPTTTTTTGRTPVSPSGKWILVLQGGRTTTIDARDYSEAVRLANQWGIGVVDIRPAEEGYAPAFPTTPTLTGYTEEELQKWQESYEIYLEYIKTPEGRGLPTPQNLADYINHADEWNALAEKQKYEPEREYRTYMQYYYAYGTPDDWYPTSTEDFFANYEKAQKQLEAWKQEAAAAEFTSEQQREYNAYRRYASAYGELEDWYATDIADFFANYDIAQAQLSKWQKQAAAVEQYELTPEEAARRREEAYGEGRIAAAERYMPSPAYDVAFEAWLPQAASRMSRALRQYVESEYSSLQRGYEAVTPKLTGFPTPEAKRAEETRRERGFQTWLPEQMPRVYQEYMGQRPWERGERYAEYSPTTRYIAW